MAALRRGSVEMSFFQDDEMRVYIKSDNQPTTTNGGHLLSTIPCISSLQQILGAKIKGKKTEEAPL